MNKSTKTKILFVYGSEPDPLFLERAASLKNSGAYEVRFVYWQRGHKSNLYYPFSNLLGAGAITPISAGDPRGSLIRRVFFSLIFTLKLAYRLRQIKPDVLYCVNINMCFSARIATLFRADVRMVYEFQDQFGIRLSRWKRYLYLWSVKRVVLTILQSVATNRFIEDNTLSTASTPQIVVPPAPASWTYRYVPVPERETLTIGYFGNFRGRAILSSLIGAAERANSLGHKVILKFAGTGVEVEYIKSVSERYDFVQFLGNFEYHTEYLDLFSSIDVSFAVFPTSNVTFKHHVARRFTEAVASGLPVIVGRDTYMASIVEASRCGWVVTEGDATELEQIFVRLCENRSELTLPNKTDKGLAHEFKFETHEPNFLSAIAAALKNRS